MKFPAKLTTKMHQISQNEAFLVGHRILIIAACTGRVDVSILCIIQLCSVFSCELCRENSEEQRIGNVLGSLELQLDKRTAYVCARCRGWDEAVREGAVVIESWLEFTNIFLFYMSFPFLDFLLQLFVAA